MLEKVFKSNEKFSYTQDTVDVIRLIRSENVGVKTFFDLVKVFGNATEAIKHVQEMSLKGGRKKPINLFSSEQAQAEIYRANKVGARIIPYNSDLYPKILKYIPDPPIILNVIGDVELLNSTCISIVGARNCSISGMQFAAKLSKDLSATGLTIVSGFARGIDTSAHKAAHKTIAVLAGGVDHIYPQENKDLYFDLAKNGCIIAELPAGSAPSSQHFPQRNRIIAGLSLATIIIESSIKSGSLITAQLALDQGREVFAVPGFPSDPRYKGNNYLLKQGALIVESATDILNNLPNLELKTVANLAEAPGDDYENRSKSIVSISDEMRETILSLLSNVPSDIESLSYSSQIPINMVCVIIVELELANKIHRHPGNKVSLNYDNI